MTGALQYQENRKTKVGQERKSFKFMQKPYAIVLILISSLSRNLLFRFQIQNTMPNRVTC